MSCSIFFEKVVDIRFDTWYYEWVVA